MTIVFNNLQYNPTERMNASDGLDHPFFASLGPNLRKLPDSKLALFGKNQALVKIIFKKLKCSHQKHIVYPAISRRFGRRC